MGFIFDMDGTMVDNMMVHHRAWQIKLNSLGLNLTLEEVRQSIHGINEEIIARLFSERFTTEERRRIAAEKEETYRQVFLPELKLIDGLSEFLEKCSEKQIPLSIASAAPAENVEFVLENLPIQHFFKAVIHAAKVSKGKPDPEVLIKAAAEMNVPLAKCLMFEDSPVGAATAFNANIPVVVVTTTHVKEEFAHLPNVVKFIKDFSEITVEETLSFLR